MDTQCEQLVTDFERGRVSRRQLIVKLMAAGATLAAGAGTSDAAALVPIPRMPESTFKAKGLNHIALTVTDLERSRVFYEKHLGMTVSRSDEDSCFMTCGRDWIALFKGRAARMHHYCYSIADYQADTAVERLKRAGLEPKRRGQRVYFDDPDGLEVQVASP